MPTLSTSRRGFTIIEMAVTLLVLGILMIAAAGTYTTVTSSTGSTNAEESIRRVASNEQLLARDWDRYSPFGADLTLSGADLTVVTSPTGSSGPDTVSLAVGSKGGLGLAAATGKGACRRFYLPPLTAADNDLAAVADTTLAGCTGASALPSGESATTPTGTTIRTS